MSFHAHPDDEALFTAGTLARAVAEGHRVVLVTATDGAAGLAAEAHTAAGDLGSTRLSELRDAGAVIGCQDVRHLGYGDSGMDAGSTNPDAFARAGIEEAATKLAAILNETSADVLTVYDPAGGYGHPDHVQVHRVGTRAAQLAGTPVVLEATVDRRPLLRTLRLMQSTGLRRALRLDRHEWSPERFARAYAEPDRITHRVDVRRHTAAKRRAMAAHATQSTTDEGTRTLAAFLRLPPFVFDRVFGHEWFVEQGRTPATRPLDDIFASLRAGSDRPG